MLKVVCKSTFCMCVFAALLVSVLANNFAHATEDVDYNVSIAPSLNLTIPSNPIIINLDPSSKTFDSKDFSVVVATNNKTGYTLTLSTPNDNTNLNRDTASDGVSAIMPTLDPGTYTQSSFTADKWGYKINSNTSIPSTITSGYVPFVSGNTLMESRTAVNHDETELSLAAKIDYLQPSGSYSTTLNFSLVAHPGVVYMQDLTNEQCIDLASSDDYTLIDIRDMNEYSVRYINGNCWMTQNLHFTESQLSPDTSDVSGDVTMAWAATDPNSNVPYYYNTGSTTYGCWYNYSAATATSLPASGYQTLESICPAGWTLPTSTQITSVTSYSTEFSPVTANGYNDGASNCPGYGRWWGSSATQYGDRPDYLCYDGDTNLILHAGMLATRKAYVRCVKRASTPLDSVENMQDVTSTIVANTPEGTRKVLKDTRDNQRYRVMKINDRLHMIKNLAIGCDGVGSSYGTTMVSKTLTPSDTNITNTNWSTPTDSLSLGNTYDYPRMTCSDTYGAWYNFAAASAGRITGSSNTTIIIEDICPKGWRLPNDAENSDIMNYPQYGKAFAPVVGGYWLGGTNSAIASSGYWWAYDLGTAVNRRRLYYGGSYSVVGDTRNNGFYVRCVAK